jgi:hypothetical protein
LSNPSADDDFGGKFDITRILLELQAISKSINIEVMEAAISLK